MRPMTIGPIRPMPTPHPHRSRHSRGTRHAAEPSTPTPMPPTQKRLADKPQAPFALPTAQPTNEASAELSLLELCLARRRKTTVKKRADAVQHQPSSVFWISQFVTSNFYLAPSITFRPASDSRYFCVGLLGESGCVIST